MDVISFEYTKQRKQLGEHPSFSDSKVECVSIPSNEEHRRLWVTRRTTSVETNSIPTKSAHYVQTERVIPANRGMQHTQGGWPYPEVKTNEPQEIERFLGRLEMKKEYQTATRRLTKVAERILQQNTTIDVYEQYFDHDDDDINLDVASAKTIAVFRDKCIGRVVQHIDWHPDGSLKIAVAYSMLNFERVHSEEVQCPAYIWDVTSPNEPEFTLIPQSPLVTLVYNPRSPDQLVGGSYNGVVGFWDLRKGAHALEASSLECSHHDPVYSIQWIQSRTGNECVSVSTDGRLLWWDVRKLSGGPTDAMTLTQASESACGGTTLEYRTDAGATRYLVGTEQGQVLLVDRKAKKDAESQKSVKAEYGSAVGRHHGPVQSVQRHPQLPKFFLTLGDWGARIWNEDLRTPIMSTPYDRSYVTGGCWSPTRPGVFFTIKADGTVDAWDYYYNQNAPAFSTKVGGGVSLSSISVHKSGRVLALGAEDGTTTVLEISATLAEPQTNEKATMAQIFERETKRERLLEIRQKERRREEAQQQRRNNNNNGGAGGKENVGSVGNVGGGGGGGQQQQQQDLVALERLLQEVEANFFNSIGERAPDVSLIDTALLVPPDEHNILGGAEVTEAAM